MTKREVDTNLIDEAVLALPCLGRHDGERTTGLWRSWKSFDWEVMNRLYAKGMIFDPVNKAKSVTLTEEGYRRCQELFWKLFGKQN
jgi:Domain of unknown function (DUF6429)